MLNKNIETNIICSSSYDPYYNLPLEEYLFRNIKENQIILYLWQNNNTIVIGRNQNPWKECKCKEFENDGGKIVRRLSGGGTVFHDLGNLNFTFIMDKNLKNLETQLQVILKSIQHLGINAYFSGRNDILVEGKKFSGNAFYEENNAYYHHGTILIDSNMDKLTNYLQVSKEKISCKGIESIRSRVVNLKKINNNIDVATVKISLQKSFSKIYGGDPQIKFIHSYTLPLTNLYSKYSSWEWNFGETPKFDICYENRFSWGGIEICFALDTGIISTTTIYSDAINCNLIRYIAQSFKEIPFNQRAVEKFFNNLEINPKDRFIIEDLKNWLNDKIK